METENGASKSKMEDYAGIQHIGRGSFGAAFLVHHKTDNNKYVLKKIRLSKETEKFKNKECEELNVIAKLRHPYILEYKDAWIEKGNCICIVTDYCEVGNISEILRKARGAYFSEEKLCKWLTQLLLAIDYLHSSRVIHGNLKLSNIFVTKENGIRLGDFGLTKILTEGLAMSVRTPNYMCPELLADSAYCYKSDIWSLGCCLFEMAAHKQAFRAPDMAGLINKINRSLISPLPIVYSSTLKQIIKSMLRKSPEHRPTAAELLRHPHLQPFLLRCHNPSSVFLPVKSPSPNNIKEKTKKASPSSINSSENNDKGEMEIKKELLHLFEESNDTKCARLLDGDSIIEDEHETKRVDLTSCSRKFLNVSEDLNSGDKITNASTSSSDAVSEERKSSSLEHSELENKEKTFRSDKNTTSRKDEGSLEVMKKSWGKEAKRDEIRVGNLELDELLNRRRAEIEGEMPGQVKADALESLLELCATLLKQDKFDELSGVLKPFGGEAVSSRETAIWLTKCLINAQNLAKKT